MAQREKEETELKIQEGLKLCVNNCGFSGSPATNNMCQKCFKATGILSPNPSSSRFPSASQKPTTLVQLPERAGDGGAAACVAYEVRLKRPAEEEAPRSPVRQVNRCLRCRKRVGLIGFRCRCGDLFCGEHRYSDEHDCRFDYRAAGKQAIARANPVVKAAKIIRI